MRRRFHFNVKTSFFVFLLKKTKSIDNRLIINAYDGVGMTGFEPATSRPPDVYSNRTELHPELCGCKSTPYF